MKKPNLVLLPGFQTNALILEELLNYMSDYYHVYFIDYPGFNINLPAFDNITMEQFVNYSQEQIDKLNLESYLLGGISFGFYIINKINIDQRCIGILAIEPFINMNCIGISKSRLYLFMVIGSFIDRFKLYKLAFKIAHNEFIKKFLTGGKEHSVSKIISTTDPRTYFKTFQLIMGATDSDEFKGNVPHVILMNPDDKTVNYEYVKETIIKKVDRVQILNMYMEHFPTDLSRKYFEEKLPPKLFTEINEFLSGK